MQSLGKHNGQQKGFTRIELFVVISAIVVLFMMVSLMPAKSNAKAYRMKCSSNLKQIALAFRIYADDNNGKFPWIPKSSGTDFTNQLQVWQYFQIISNELGSTKILLCPQEDGSKRKQRASDFSGAQDGLGHHSKQNHSVSYFLGIYSSESLTNAILAGDRTVTTRINPQLYSSNGTNAVEVATNSIWSSAPMQANHEGVGNFALADGSVRQSRNAGLQAALRLARDSYGTNANRFLFPQ
jgi:Tfp pilus assembly protein PilE